MMMMRYRSIVRFMLVSTVAPPVLVCSIDGGGRDAQAQQVGNRSRKPKEAKPKEEPKEERKEEPKEEPKKELTPPPEGATQGGILDFCRDSPKENKDKFTKQRIVLFGLGGQDIAEGEERGVDPETGASKLYTVFKDIDVMRHLNEVFLSVMPMPRFFHVIAESEPSESGNNKNRVLPAPSEFYAQKSIDLKQLAEKSKVSSFVKRSIGCADWVAIPRLVGKKAEWKIETKKKKVDGKEVEYKAWNLEPKWNLEMDIFKVTGGQATLKKTVKGTNGGLVGMAMNLASGALSLGSSASKEQPDYISKHPVNTCKMPEVNQDATVSLSACLGFSIELGIDGIHAPGTGQSRASVCKDVDDDASHKEVAMRAVATCEVRKAIEQSTLDLQKSAKRTDGWKLFSPLLSMPELPEQVGVAMGKSEGAARGDVYVAVVPGENGTTKRVGFGRLVSQGPGGEDGERQPSRFKWRVGEAPIGTRMEEYAQLGVVLGLQPGFTLFTSKGDLQSGLGLGFSVMGGYDASRFINLGDEFWSRIYYSYHVGKGGLLFQSFDLVPELTFYGPTRLNYIAGLGVGYTSVRLKSGGEAGAASEEISGSSYGVAAQGGLEFILHPDWHARLSVFYRQNFSKAELKTKGDDVVGSAGTLSAFRSSLSLAYTF